jgi:RNA-binding protein YhbY
VKHLPTPNQQKSALQHDSFDVVTNTLAEGIDVDLVETRGHNILLYKAPQEP